jgi:hypothetical protein
MSLGMVSLYSPHALVVAPMAVVVWQIPVPVVRIIVSMPTHLAIADWSGHTHQDRQHISVLK